ncbi:DUF1905 domain-containing protein [Devosia sp.]
MAKFETSIAQMGNNTGIEVPPAVIEMLGGGKKPAVVVTIGAFTYRSTVGVMGGKFLIPLSADRRTQSGLKGGDRIDVQLELDDAPRSVSIPDDLAAALNGDRRPRHSLRRLLSATGSVMYSRSPTPRRTRPGGADWTRPWPCCERLRSSDTGQRLADRAVDPP